MLKHHRKVVGGVALAALIAYAGYKVYKSKFSAAAKACKGTAGGAKAACMKQQKVIALKAQVADMQKAGSYCAKTKDPGKCLLSVTKKVQKLKAKAAKAAA